MCAGVRMECLLQEHLGIPTLSGIESQGVDMCRSATRQRKFCAQLETFPCLLVLLCRAMQGSEIRGCSHAACMNNAYMECTFCL